MHTLGLFIVSPISWMHCAWVVFGLTFSLAELPTSYTWSLRSEISFNLLPSLFYKLFVWLLGFFILSFISLWFYFSDSSLLLITADSSVPANQTAQNLNSKEWSLNFSLKLHKVLVRVSIAVKRHYDHGNSYKGKHLIGAGLWFQRFSPLSSWWGAWQHVGRHGAGKVAESSTSWPTGSKRRLWATLSIVWAYETSKPASHSDTPPPTKSYLLPKQPHLLIGTPYMGQAFKIWVYGVHCYSNHHSFPKTCSWGYRSAQPGPAHKPSFKRSPPLQG